MFKIEIEFRNKQKRTALVQSYMVGGTMLALVYTENQEYEYLNLRDVSKIYAKSMEVVKRG